jgi:hypothetical protein
MLDGLFQDLLLTVFPLHPHYQYNSMDCFRFLSVICTMTRSLGEKEGSPWPKFVRNSSGSGLLRDDCNASSVNRS